VKKDFISYGKSLDILNGLEIKNQFTKKVFISDSLGKIIATNIVASENSPAFKTSAMDGYAI
jgi:molybdopterin molybdotransferase